MISRRHVLKPAAARLYERQLAGPGSRAHAWLISHPAESARWAFRATLCLYPALACWSWARIGVRKVLRRKPAVLWAPTPILTITEGSNVLKREGYPSETLVFTTYYITSDFDHNAFPLVANPATATWFPSALFVWAMLRFDVFHFYFDGGLWSGMKIMPPARFVELPLLRLAGKRVIVSAYGADVRVKKFNDLYQPFNICNECPAPGKHCICTDDELSTARFTADWANVSLAMGDMHDFVPGSRLDVPYWPIDTSGIADVGVPDHAGPVRIAHSPNHREFKGTRFLLAAVDELRARGHDVELDLIERVSNVEAKARYAQADVVVAQCLAGWIGYTELEAMAMGKPTVSFFRDQRYIEVFPGCPVVSADPDHLVDALERLVTDASLRRELAVRGRSWTEQFWSYEAVGRRYRELHDDVWRSNRLWNRIAGRARDASFGRGWRPGRRGEWVNPAASIELDRVGGQLVGFWGARETRRAAIAAIAALGGRGHEADIARFRDLALGDPTADLQTIALAGTCAAQAGRASDVVDLLDATGAGARTTGDPLLDACCRAVALADLAVATPACLPAADAALDHLDRAVAELDVASLIAAAPTTTLFAIHAYLAAIGRHAPDPRRRAVARQLLAGARRRELRRPFGGPDAR